MNLNPRRFRRTTMLTVGLLSFLLGLITVKVFSWTPFEYWWLIVVALVPLLRRRRFTSIVSVIVIGLFIGVWRGSYIQSEVAGYAQYVGESVVLRGQIKDDPVYDDAGRMDFRLSKVQVAGEALPGEVRVRGFVNDVRRGDVIAAEGKLRDGFGNYQAEISYAEIAVANRPSNIVEDVRRAFFTGTYDALPEPHASLGLGFLVGLRSALPEDFDDQLRIAGLTHIVVASGYNLTILVRLSRRMLAQRSKYQAFIGSIALVLGFILVTGASPSITRAAVVTLLSLGAWYYGRQIHPVLIIFLGAALTAGYNPLYIWHDLGWWLSFLAFAGVLILAPLITRLLYRREHPPLLVQVGSETVAAQIMATPLIMFIFGEVSLVAVLANLVVVPLIPLAMIGTFAAGLAGIFMPVVAAWIALPARLVLGYIVSMTQLFARPAWAQQSIELDTFGITTLYIVVVLLGAALYRRTRLRFREVPAIVE